MSTVAPLPLLPVEVITWTRGRLPATYFMPLEAFHSLVSCGRAWLTAFSRPAHSTPVLPEDSTCRDEDGGHTGGGAEQQGAAERPSSAETVHGDPGESVAGDFNKTDEGEIQVLVATQAGRVHRHTVIDEGIGSPE